MRRILIALALLLLSVSPTLAMHRHALHPIGVVKLQDTPIDCIADAVYHEARGTSDTDRDIVAQLVIKRTLDDHYPNDACSVVHHHKTWRGRTYYQFPWYHSKTLRPIRDAHEFHIARVRALIMWERRSEARFWRAEYISTHCRYDHRNYALVRKTHAQCYLADKKSW